MLRYLSFLFFALVSLLFSQDIISNSYEVLANPVLLYYSDAEIIYDTDDSVFSVVLPKDRLLSSAEIITHNGKAFIFLPDSIIMEISKFSRFNIDISEKRLNLIEGDYIFSSKSGSDTLSYSVVTDSASISFSIVDSFSMMINDTLQTFSSGDVIMKNLIQKDHKRSKKSASDALYLFDLIDKGKIPDDGYSFNFPSEKRAFFRESFEAHTGVASYNGEKYYLGGIYAGFRVWELEFIYDLWFAANKGGGFYDEAWNEWEDLLDHIHLIQLYKKDSPFYLRVGFLEDITLGSGLLVQDYTNAIILPFERHNGIEIGLNAKNNRTNIFVNNIGKPRLLCISLD